MPLASCRPSVYRYDDDDNSGDDDDDDDDDDDHEAARPGCPWQAADPQYTGAVMMVMVVMIVMVLTMMIGVMMMAITRLKGLDTLVKLQALSIQV